MLELPEDVQNCIGFEPTNWTDQGNTLRTDYPPKVLYKLFFSAILLMALVIFYVRDASTRYVRASWCGTKPDDKEFLKVEEGDVAHYPSFHIATFFMYYVVGTYTVREMLQAFLYWIFLAEDTDISLNMACYIQWYREGEIAAGQFTDFIFQLGWVIFFYLLAFWYRPSVAVSDARIGIQAFISVEN